MRQKKSIQESKCKRAPNVKISVKTTFQTVQIKCRNKTFFKQRIAEAISMRKFFFQRRHSQNNHYTNHGNKEDKQIKLIQMNIIHASLIKQTLTCHSFALSQKFKSTSKCRTESSTHCSVSNVIKQWSEAPAQTCQKNLRGKKLYGTNRGSNFLIGSFNSRTIVRKEIPSRFFVKDRAIHFI